MFSSLELFFRRVFRFAGRHLNVVKSNGGPASSAKISYSQAGEDVIIDFALKAMEIANPTYLDVGANHPFLFSNTYYFYTKGSCGVTVEPDPMLHALLLTKRPRDLHLNIGVSSGMPEKLPFFIMSNPTLNTFCADEALRYSSLGSYRISRQIDVDLIPISDIFERHFFGKAPDIVSIDVEGMDLAILHSIDYEKYRPIVICVETIVFSEKRESLKIVAIEEFLSEKGYMVYADTHINTIFVDRKRWSAS